ncbi:hypothetical protein ACHAXH_008883 [Discostella pseudostelligera]|jgi:hypothetical protein
MKLIQQYGQRNRYRHGMCCLLMFMHITTYASALLASHCQCQSLKAVKTKARSHWASQSINNDDNDTDDDDFDEDDNDDVPTVKPYRNRSLAWTLRYRKLNPYEKARARVISFGHRSKEDWDEAASSGQLGQYVPTYPDEMYAPEWVGWDEWLGLMRSYNDTQQLAASILGLKSLEEYYFFVKSDSKRAEGLRIPLRPELYYEDEWIDEKSFFRQS